MSDLFDPTISMALPERLEVFGRIGQNQVYRFAHPARTVEARLSQKTVRGKTYWQAVTNTGLAIAVVDGSTSSLLGCDAVLRLDDISSAESIEKGLRDRAARWLLPKPEKPDPHASLRDDTRRSWKGLFVHQVEEYDDGHRIKSGLRPPQSGALHATKAHWSVSTQPATLVLPTGSGKTDTMAALLISEQIPCLLVIVPTDALRRQISRKFSTLDVLRSEGLIPEDLKLPTVAVLTKGLKTTEDVEALAATSNVIITTMSVLSAMSVEMRRHLAMQITHLFIDEAHHIGARTWKEFKQYFKDRSVLQYTATPYRNDGVRLDGRFIYVYPLRRAQRDGLFTPISYVPIRGRGETDTHQQIIDAVGRQLDADHAKGFNHLAMARTSTVGQAIVLHGLYSRRLPQHRPALIHSKMPASQRDLALSELRAGRSKIIVCVDMLGEGFDLPDLKIAALHDRHKSESVTLQFVGRFTRVRQDLGSATVIANVAISELPGQLTSLYAEDADWNHLLSVIGHTSTERERRREDVFSGFAADAEAFPLETLEPRLSTIVYRTTCTEWTPEAAEDATKPLSTIVEAPVINREHRLVVFVRRDEERLRWTSVKSVRNIFYNMIMAHWSPDQNLLYIHGSDLGDLHTELAKAITGDTAQRVTGEPVFRVLHGFRRLMLTNLGLSETQRKPVRYSQFMGSDIGDQLDTLPGNQSRTKTNLFGLGFVDIEHRDDGGDVFNRSAAKETIGCSRKGKFWSYRTTNSFAEWIDWCHDLGNKLLNEAITPEAILRNLVRPQRITALPSGKVPIAIAWPEEFLEMPEDRIELEGNRVSAGLFDCEIELDAFEIREAIPFSVIIGTERVPFELRVSDVGASFIQLSGTPVVVRRGKNRKPKQLSEIFLEDPPHIYFADGDVLIASDLLVLARDGSVKAYDPDKIEALDWSGVDIKAESQGLQKKRGTVQRHIIDRLQRADPPYDIIFDDDGTGEVADIVAIRRTGHSLLIDLFHCKYSAGALPGARVQDLYEVCGQAQKSVRWAAHFVELLQHLRRREDKRIAAGQPTRFERGNETILYGLISSSREMFAEFSVSLVQPGYSRAKAARSHLELFAATESYLMETWRMPLRILASE